MFTLFLLNLSSQLKSLNTGFSIQAQNQAINLIADEEPIFQKSPNRERSIQLANAFLYLKKFKKAISYYEYALSMGPLAEMELEKYFSALYEYGDTYTAKSVAKEFSVRFLKSKLLDKLAYYDTLQSASQLYTETNISLNTEYNEFGLYPLFADYKVFNSDLIKTKINNESLPSFNPFSLSTVELSSSNPKLLPMNGQDESFCILTCYDPRAKLAYLTINENNIVSKKFKEIKPSTNKIYTATIDPFFKIKNLTEFRFNSNSYSVGQATISPDGNMLYFVSDMPGGFGGTDIYRCLRLEDGSWGAPINIGNQVNSPGDEFFPHMSPTGNTLYFSSTFHSVYGGLDINKSSKTRFNVFEKPINLGAPFNSNKDDFGFIFIGKDEKEGYFSSDRPGGKGGSDIYQFTVSEEEVEETEPAESPADSGTKVQEEIEFKSSKAE